MFLGNERQQYNTLLEHASKLLTPSQVSVLKLGLSLHVYSPKVQMYEQIAHELKLPDCQSIADIGGNVVCNIEDIKAIIDGVSFN